MNRVGFLIIFLLIVTSISFSQNIEYYIPAGFTNPLLKSGQFISSLYFYTDQRELQQDPFKTNISRKEINLLGFLGITDKMTLKTKFLIIPSQTTFQIEEGGFGEDKDNFSISPELSLSYRPKVNLEIFSTLYYSDQVTKVGDRAYIESVPVIDPNTGNIIYERRTVIVPSEPNLTTTNTTFIIGLSYLGELW